MTLKKTFFLWLTLGFVFFLQACVDPTPSGPITMLEACEGSPDLWREAPDLNRPTAGLDRYNQTLTSYFDTSLSLSIFVEDEADVEAIFACTEAIYRHIHQIATRYTGFDGVNNPYYINQHPDVDHEIDPLLFEMIALAIEYYTLTDGLFDVTLGPVLDVWGDALTRCNEGGPCEVPSSDALEAAQAFVGVDRVILDEAAQTVRLEEGASLDLGGIGKGFAARVVGDFLNAHNDVAGFILNAGTSNIEVNGIHPVRDNGRWVIGLTDPASRPFLPESFARVSLLSNTNMMTSGDYQRYFTVDGVRYHHILDPRTLEPSNTMRAITIVGDDALIGDIWATALFIMTVDEALARLESLEGYHGIIYGLDGTIYTTEGFSERFLLEIVDD